MSNVLHFIASTNVKNLIGKDLVTDQITAVFELVKNSYDADATEVYIEFININSGNGSLIIRDNGTGMDLNDIQNKWMVIGTESKKNKGYSDKYKRPINGDKGIGRFSVDRLGKELELYAIKESSNSKIEMKFDWTEFENDYKDLHLVEIPYEEYPTKNEQGVALVINKLRDTWDDKAINKLVRSLRQFKSPFQMDDNFKMFINVPEYNMHNKEVTPYNLGEISSLWVNAEIPISDPTKIIMKIYKDGIEYSEELKNPYRFGPIKSRIYFFNQPDKVRFSSRMAVTVKDFGNIRLYRDNFRIYPYGDSLNDWLDLDVRKAQKHLGRFGSRDLVGYVQIYKKYNLMIDAPTNRQGIIDNGAARELREFIVEYPVRTLEKYFFSFKKAKNETVAESKKQVSDAISDLRKVVKEIQDVAPSAARLIKQVTDVVEKGQAEQSSFIKNQEELIKVYQRVASKEVLLHRIIHEALINIDAAKSGIVNLNNVLSDLSNNSNGIFTNINTISQGISLAVGNAWLILLKARDNVIQHKEKIRVNIKEFINEVASGFEEKLNTNGVSLNVDSKEDIFYTIDRKDLQTIVENFISNSIKSLALTKGRERKIWIKVMLTDRNLILNFKDNGIGISEHLRNRIFDPFFSTTGSFGMGLSIVDEIVKEYNGELNLVDNNESGAEFQLKLRR